MESPHVRLVLDIDEYARTCRDVSNAIHQGTQLDICVRDPHVADWLPKFVAKYDADHTRVIRLTPRLALAERWGIAIPDDVTNKDILNSGVLKERIFPTPGQSFEDIVLQHYFGGELIFPSLQLQRLDVLLNSYHETNWDAALSLALVSRVFREKLCQWEDTAKNEDVRFLVNCLIENPAALRQDLINFKILKNYPPELGEKVLLKKWKTFRKRNIETDALVFNPEEAAEVATNVDYYLAREKSQITDPEKLLNLINQMSGNLNREFYIANDILREHPEWISEQVLSKLEERFAPIAVGLRSEFDKLHRSVKPNFPREPDNSWEARQWLDWVRIEYMPYYTWLEAQGITDNVVSWFSERFGDWFYENFSALKNSEQDLFEFASLSLEKERIREKGAISLVLLMDNLNLVHFDALCQSFNANGLTLETVQPKFSLAPTATEVSKAALISMQGSQTETPAEGYSEIVQKVWGGILKEQTARYLSKISELQNLQELKECLLFLNYLPVDEALHADVSHTGQNHADIISDLLDTLAKAVTTFAHKFQVKDRLNVYVLSDHGSTRIAKTVANVFDKTFYKGIAMDKHHRYLALDDDKFDSLPQVVDAQCYLFDRQKFGTRKNFISARGYYRFTDTSETFFVHGGLSPEEVVVPFARFSFAAIEPQPLTIRLLKREYRYAVKSQIAFEVGNPNNYDLTNVSMSLVDAENDEVILPVLKAHQLVQNVEFTTVFHKATNVLNRENTQHLLLRCRFNCQGRPFAPDDVTFEITLKAMMEEIDDGYDF